ncbi:MAG: hypothetical protein IJK32_08750 [Bacteroidales bacterium]|nr:hypothetical protein [Bacteroidales bacterium]
MNISNFCKSLLLAALLAVASCTQYVSHPDWSPDAKKALNSFIRSERNQKEKPYVVFDFDNTCSIFDISEQLMIYQLETMCFNLSPEAFSQMAMTGMGAYPESLQKVLQDIVGGYQDLYNRYGPFTPNGVDNNTAVKMREDPAWKNFAIGMGRMYDLLQDYMTADEAYLWTMGWFAGMTGEEIYQMAIRSHELYSSVETLKRSWTGEAGTHSWIDGVSVTDNIRELWKALYENGIDIWVCSASEVAPVRAAVDVFGLHDYCKGVIAMTMARDSAGRYIPEYDFTNGHGFLAGPDGSWIEDDIPTRTQPWGQGKVDAIRNCLVPRYGGKGPLAGFMDSSGDFNFCTEFSSMRLVICFNRANRKVTEGGGLIAEVAMYEKEALGYNLKKATKAGDILYILQGRDENGMRSLRPSEKTICLGEKTPKVFDGEDNARSLEYFKEKHLTVKEILETYCIATDVSDPSNPLGFSYGFLDRYDGYKSKE